MEITPVQDFDLPRLYGRSGEPRSPGLHISEIIHAYRKYSEQILTFGTKKSKPKEESNWSSEDLFNTGFLWEDALEYAFRMRSLGIERPTEILYQGIYLSPDGYNAKTNIMHEYKLTWKKMEDLLPAHMPHWMMQAKAYCKAMGCTQVRFWVCHVMGDYGKNSGPRLKVYDVTFTQAEIDQGWANLINFAKSEGMILKQSPTNPNYFGPVKPEAETKPKWAAPPRKTTPG